MLFPTYSDFDWTNKLFGDIDKHQEHLFNLPIWNTTTKVFDTDSSAIFNSAHFITSLTEAGYTAKYAIPGVTKDEVKIKKITKHNSINLRVELDTKSEFVKGKMIEFPVRVGHELESVKVANGVLEFVFVKVDTKEQESEVTIW